MPAPATANTTPPTTPPADPPYDRDALFDRNGPFHPLVMQEAVRTLLRALPIDPTEPEPWYHRRQVTTLMALAALHPRDEIEIMLGVQALCAFHAAAVGWHLGMNQTQPPGSGLRHFTAAASAARAFDTLLRARWSAARPNRCPSPRAAPPRASGPSSIPAPSWPTGSNAAPASPPMIPSSNGRPRRSPSPRRC